MLISSTRLRFCTGDMPLGDAATSPALWTAFVTPFAASMLASAEIDLSRQGAFMRSRSCAPTCSCCTSGVKFRSASGVSTGRSAAFRSWRYYIAIAGSFVAELMGDLAASTRWAELAEEMAPDPLLRFKPGAEWPPASGVTANPVRTPTLPARRCSGTTNRPGDDRIVRLPGLSLDIADEILEPSRRPRSAAPDILRRDRRADVRGHRDDRTACSELLHVFRPVRGDAAQPGSSREAYLHAFGIYRQAGLRRRASIVAYRLLVLTGDPNTKTSSPRH